MGERVFTPERSLSVLSSISDVSSTLPSSGTAFDPVKAADDVLKSLLQSTEVLQSLVTLSSKYVPPSDATIMSTMWGLFNTSGSAVITKDDVQKAVFSVGTGGTSAVDALWSQLDPENKGSISAGDFAKSPYLATALGDMSKELLAAIEDMRQSQAAAAPASGSLLDFVAPGGRSGTILDLFV
jgi:hypothetical protein